MGVGHVVGSLERGKMADIVLWPTATFGAKPTLVIKGGLINWSIMGDPNASIPTPEPVLYHPMFGAEGRAAKRTSVTFVSKAAIERGVPGRLGLERQIVAVQNCRGLQKQSMVRNGATPEIRIDPETYKVYVDGRLATVAAADRLALTHLYHIV
jgi:urease subunit alpha